MLPLASLPASRSQNASSRQSLTLFASSAVAESCAAAAGGALSAAGIACPPASSDSSDVTAAAQDAAQAAVPRQKVVFNVIRSRCHHIVSATVEKAGLCSFDDKRYVLDDGVNTLAHGHWRIL